MSHPLAGPFDYVALRGQGIRAFEGEFNTVINTDGDPVAVSDGTYIMPWHSVKYLRRVKDEPDRES